MTEAVGDIEKDAAAEFSRPLCLTVTEDLRGFIAEKIGYSILFLITFVSVIAVFLIFFFVISETIPFVFHYLFQIL